jgi:hypothetical protein
VAHGGQGVRFQRQGAGLPTFAAEEPPFSQKQPGALHLRLPADSAARHLRFVTDEAHEPKLEAGFDLHRVAELVAEGEEESTDASAKEGAEVSPAGDAAADNKGPEAAENKTPVAAEPAEPGEEIPAELLGGWSIPADYTKTALPEDVQAAFEKGAEQFFGNELVPMACLGKQTAEGTNYAVLCHSLLTTAEAVESVQVVTIYKDIDGNAYITSANTVDPASFVKADTQAENGADARAASEKQAD